jgi:cytosine/adenosine deaminase-related metal-dependent hydrolase
MMQTGGKFTISQPIPLYRKFTARHIFNGHHMLHGDAVLITDETGVVIDIADKKNAGDGIEHFEGLLTPGFVNSHCHLELSHMKGVIPTGTGLVNFVQQVMGKRTANIGDKLSAMRSAEQELYNSGTVAVGDICNTTDSVAVKTDSKLQWHHFIEVSGFVDATAEKRLGDMREVFQSFKAMGNEQAVSFSPHAPYSVSKKLFSVLNDETAAQLVTIHNQESEAENELYQNKLGDFLNLYANFGIDISGFEPTGKRSLQSWLPYFTHGQSIILVHNTYTNEEDISFSLGPTENSKPKTFFCLCPNANLYIEGKMPPVNLLRQHHCDIILGTDSYASNRQLNLFEEVRTIQNQSGLSIPLEEILTWATINGARALQMDGWLGSFDKGKKPGIVFINEMDGLKITARSTAQRIL